MTPEIKTVPSILIVAFIYFSYSVNSDGNHRPAVAWSGYLVGLLSSSNQFVQQALLGHKLIVRPYFRDFSRFHDGNLVIMFDDI